MEISSLPSLFLMGGERRNTYKDFYYWISVEFDLTDIVNYIKLQISQHSFLDFKIQPINLKF